MLLAEDGTGPFRGEAVNETGAAHLQSDQPGNRTEQDPAGPRNGNHDTPSNDDWVWANYFCLGPVSSAYRAVERHARKRLRQWLCAKHKIRGQATKQFSITALHQVLGLVELTTRTSSFPWAKP